MKCTFRVFTPVRTNARHSPASWMKEIEGGKRVLTTDFHFWINGLHYVIRKGFVWDGASIPKIFQWKYGTPFDEAHLIGGLIHDAIYANAVEYHGDAANSALYAANPGLADFTRFEADNLYYKIIREHGACTVLAIREWVVVRIFGGSHWDKR